MPQGGLARTPSGTGLVERGSKLPKYALSSHFQMQPGFLEVEAASMVYVLMIKSLGPWQCGRLGPPCASKCAPEGLPAGPVESAFGAVFWVQNHFDCGFLLPPAAQLYCGAGGMLWHLVSVCSVKERFFFTVWRPWRAQNPM